MKASTPRWRHSRAAEAMACSICVVFISAECITARSARPAGVGFTCGVPLQVRTVLSPVAVQHATPSPTTWIQVMGDGMDFELDAREHDGWLVVAISGDIDVYTVSRLSGFLADQLPPIPPLGAQRGVVVDLSVVTFIDSAGLGALVGGYRRARDRSRGLRLAGPSAELETMLSLTGLLEVVETFADVETATSPATA